ncbi:MAG: Zn-binding dehydrogenase [Rhodobacteraceae bacterium HLUCCA12]|nr:MAG: Zn-binding dehydrogenase [Rhodobacteraceae bacterium HLUCCA12]
MPETTPQTTHGLALREGGFARGPVPQVPHDLSPFLEWREIALPPLQSGQVLIEVIMAPVNPSDLFFVQGGYGQPRISGNPAGFEGVGRVIAAEGSAATPLLGRRVAFLGTVTGSWTRHAISDAALCIPLRDDLKDADGAALIVNPLTAIALLDEVRAQKGNAFILNAAGSQLGRLILGLAQDEGLDALAVIRRADMAEELQALGAAEVLVSTAADFPARSQAALRAHKPRVLLDAVGDQGAADLFFAMPAGARWISYGKMSDDAPSLTQMGQFIFMDKRIEGFWLSRWLPAASAERRAAVVAQVQDRFATGRWHTRIAAQLPLDRALDAILPALQGGEGKVMLCP